MEVFMMANLICYGCSDGVLLLKLWIAHQPAELFLDRTEVQCLHPWQKVLNPELIKGPWTQEEDDKIIDVVNKYGPTKWSHCKVTTWTYRQAMSGEVSYQNFLLLILECFRTCSRTCSIYPP